MPGDSSSTIFYPRLHLDIDNNDDPPEERVMDTITLGFSRSFVLSSASHLDKLQKLINYLNLNNGRLTGSNGGALKKLKP